MKRLFELFKSKPRHQKRRYQAAITNRLSSDWNSSILSADSEIHRDLRILRSRSRDLCMNNDYARRFLKRASTNVIGANGIRLQVRASDKSGSILNHINEMVEQQFESWAKKGICTIDGRLSWIDAQRIFLESVARDGESLVRLIKGKEAGNDFGFSLQFIEADHLDEELNQSLENGCYIRMGIEFNKHNRPTHYHLLETHPGEQNAAGNGYPRKAVKTYNRVPAAEIIHGFLVERISASRGVPWMHTAMHRLKMLAGYEEAELVAARVGASKMGFFISPDGAGYGNPEDAAGNPVMEADPGSFEQLPSGMDVRMFDPNHPTTSFACFEKAVLRGIASGLDISYNTLANDLENVNFSSIRHGSLEDRDTWKSLQNWVIEHFCTPIFEAWLLMAITSGKLKLPLSEFDIYNKPVWRARGWAWVDPLKENHANQIALREKTKTRSQIAADQGIDIEELFSQIAFEQELAKSYGIDLDSIDKARDKDAGNNNMGNSAQKENEEIGDE